MPLEGLWRSGLPEIRLSIVTEYFERENLPNLLVVVRGALRRQYLDGLFSNHLCLWFLPEVQDCEQDLLG